MVKKYFHGYFYDLVIEASQFKIWNHQSILINGNEIFVKMNTLALNISQLMGSFQIINITLTITKWRSFHAVPLLCNHMI